MGFFLRFFLVVFSLFFTVTSLFAMGKEYIILRARDTGLFSSFFDVLSLLKEHEKGRFAGVEVDFARKGPYYSPFHGSNWWRYYFAPIRVGNKNKNHITKIKATKFKGVTPWDIEYNTSRKQVNDLIKKYIRLQPTVESFIEDFVQRHFSLHAVVAVHYRGTDKISEAPRVTYEAVAEKVAEVLTSFAGRSCKIFIASDERGFIEYMEDLFPGIVCYNEEAMRSSAGKPIHLNCDNPYKAGFDAVVDCLLLSKGDILLRTSSNLSLAATYFNPDIPVIELSKRY
jgi:hypothetical protein